MIIFEIKTKPVWKKRENLGKSLFENKIRFAIEKNFGAISILRGKTFVVAIKKNASHTIFIYRSYTIFFISRLFYWVQIAAETSSNLFSMIFLKCMYIV